MGKRRKGKKNKRKFIHTRVASLGDDLLIVIVKVANQRVFQQTCPIGNQKQMNNLLYTLDAKGFINLDMIRKEKGWFE